MIIRKAKIEDSERIADYFLLAMKDIIYFFTGQKDDTIARNFLLYFIAKENNQYSWQNTWVVEEDNKIVAAANLYDGAKLYVLRAPVVDYIRTEFGRDFTFEDETEVGEYYLDCIGVHPDHQGQGLGSKFLLHLIHEYGFKNQQTIGVLVDEDNPSAKKLYIKLGFKPVGNKTLTGKRMEHLQIKG